MMAVLSHALALAGIAVMAVVVRLRVRREQLSLRVAVDGVFLMAAAGLLSGHAADVLLNRGAELRDDLTILLPGSGGSASAGALAGAAVAGLPWFRRRAAGRGRAYADTIALGGILGLGFVRLGCFACHEHLSAVTSSPLALPFPGGARHDLGLDEAVLCFALFALLAALDRRRRRLPDGTLLAVAALVYGAGRFGLDTLRVDDPRAAGLTAAQFVSLVLVAGGGAWLALRRGGSASPATWPRRDRWSAPTSSA